MAQEDSKSSPVNLLSYTRTTNEGDQALFGMTGQDVLASPSSGEINADGVRPARSISFKEPVTTIELNPATQDSPIDVPEQMMDTGIGTKAADPATHPVVENATELVADQVLHNTAASTEQTPDHMNNLGNGNVKGNEISPGIDYQGLVMMNKMSGERELSEEITLTWKRVDVFVSNDKNAKRKCCSSPCCPRSPSQTKQILFDVSGEVKPGSLLAIMGSSGAGKSTLMNVLAYRNVGQMSVTGAVKVNGREIGSQMATLAAYVQQQDLFIGTLTVREHLNFYALLRMGKGVSQKKRKERVEQVLLELGLDKCANTIIGIPGRIRGISGGEQKRLSFASEILTDPHLLFADEPTSGLDSFMAMNVISSLKKVAAGGRTVLCTIHQPSSEVYAMFDSILLLAGGRVAYMGPTTDVLPWFRDLGYPCPTNFNPADFFVYTLAVIPGQEDESKERIKAICDGFAEKKSDGAKNGNLQRVNSFRCETLPAHQQYKASWPAQFKAVLKRTMIAVSRDVLLSRIKLIQAVVVGFIAGLIYLQIENDQDSIQNVSGALFFLVTTSSFSSLQGVLFVFPVELPVFLREHKNGMYRTDVYFLAKTLAELPINILATFLQLTVAYWMMGLRKTFVAFITCYGIIQMVQFTAMSYGYVISTLAPTVTAATSLGPPLMLPLMLFGGFFLKDKTIPVYFIWLKYISWFRYGFEATSINQWKGLGELECSSAVHSANETSAMKLPCFKDGDAVLEYLGYENETIAFNVIILLVLIIGFRFIAFLLLLRRSSQRH